MGRKKVEGVCAICGQVGALTFEHIPPRAAFNDGTFYVIPSDKAMEMQPGEQPKGPLFQGGIGMHSLCGRCNNNTGGWYARAFIEWCYWGYVILSKTEGKPSRIHLPGLYPLRILKQAISMFLSINYENPFREIYPELAKFVLQRDNKGLDPKYRLFAYYNYEGNTRYQPITWLGDLDQMKKTICMVEIAHPPFGLVLTIDSAPPDDRLFEITFFSQYDYDQKADLSLKLPVLPTYSIIPADYRSDAEVRKHFE